MSLVSDISEYCKYTDKYSNITFIICLNLCNFQRDTNDDHDSFESYEMAQCLPAQTLLAALDVTHVDFFSLDIEGGEMSVLRNFPWNDITVDLWAIEHVPTEKWKKLCGKVVFRSRNITLNQMIKNTETPKNEIEEVKTLFNCIEDIDLISFMITKGYYYLDVLCYPITDLIFVRVDSLIFKKLNVPQFALNRTTICADKHLLAPDNTGIAPNLSEFRDWHHFPSIAYRDI